MRSSISRSPEHPPRLTIERVAIEPVKRLRDGHDVDRRRFHPAFGSGSDQVGDSLVWDRRRDLCRAGVGRDDIGEMFSQADGCLPVTSCAVPRDSGVRRAGRQLGKEARRVTRPMESVLGRTLREEIFEVPQLFFAVFTNTDENVCSTRSLLHFGHSGRLDGWSLIRSLRENVSPQDAQRYSYVGTAVLRRSVVRQNNRSTRNQRVDRLTGVTADNVRWSSDRRK